MDGKECLKKKNSMAQNSSTIYDLATNEEILYFQYHEYKPTRLIFSQENIVVELTQEAMPMYFVKLLFENGVITEDCQINKDKIDLFISKYGKLPERIIITD
ncbi:MAG: hypothetical protein R2728_04005 [Chitinophagales bacterium]